MGLRKRMKKVFRGIGAPSARARETSFPVSPTENSEQKKDIVTVGVVSPEILSHNSAAARLHSVESAVHPADFIYWFHVAHPSNPSVGAPIRHYFDEGAKSAHKLVSIIDVVDRNNEKKVHLLEFASGYGRLSRHLKRYPHIDLCCSDIHEEAIDFLSNTLGVNAFLSHSEPEQFETKEKFDVTFALSFFTHMPKATFGRWMRALYQTLNPGGRLIFTTHGYANLADVPDVEIPSDGFLYLEMSEQKDLDLDEYGVSITKPEYVMAQIIEHTGSHHIVCKQSNWDEKQDLWIVHRT